MRNIETFDQANQALSEYISSKAAKKYDLERMRKLMNHLGNPQNQIDRIIHVAGTSGKTSTSYFIASLLKKAGFRTGLTVSPHIDEVNERVQIDLVPLPEKEFCAELSQFLELVDQSGLKPSYFEIMVAFAFYSFYMHQVDYAVIEVGLGGLLDGTNVIDRSDKICVITDIGFDHTEILGDTIEEITAQKAGIIQYKNDVFMNNQQDDMVIHIVRRKCLEMQAKLHITGLRKVGNEYRYEYIYESIDIPYFQKRNLNLAIKTVKFALKRDHAVVLSEKNILDASDVYIPARMEEVTYHEKTYLFDGSHNEQKIDALVYAISRKFPDKKLVMLVSFGENKRPSVLASLKLLRKLGSDIVLTSFSHGQDEIRSSIDPEELAKIAKQADFVNIVVEPNPKLALKKLEAMQSDICLITGSFYLLSHYRFLVKRLARLRNV